MRAAWSTKIAALSPEERAAYWAAREAKTAATRIRKAAEMTPEQRAKLHEARSAQSKKNVESFRARMAAMPPVQQAQWHSMKSNVAKDREAKIAADFTAMSPEAQAAERKKRTASANKRNANIAAIRALTIAERVGNSVLLLDEVLQEGVVGALLWEKLLEYLGAGGNGQSHFTQCSPILQALT